MAEGDFVRGNLKVTDARSRECLTEIDYSQGETKLTGAHYGADEMMVQDIVAHLRGGNGTTPPSRVCARTHTNASARACTQSVCARGCMG